LLWDASAKRAPEANFLLRHVIRTPDAVAQREAIQTARAARRGQKPPCAEPAGTPAQQADDVDDAEGADEAGEESRRRQRCTGG
jgi:hypothetical protein